MKWLGLALIITAICLFSIKGYAKAQADVAHYNFLKGLSE